MENGGLGIRRVGLFNRALLGNWLWRFGKEGNRLWHQVIAAKYGEARGGWCTRIVRGTHGCGMWKSIRGLEKFFGQVMYNVGEGDRISFWHDPWCGSNLLKDLFPDLFTRFRSKEAWISDLIVSASEEGSRSCNFHARRAPEDWEQENFCSFIEFLYSHMPRGEGDDTLTWKLTKKGVFNVRSYYKLLSGPYNEVFPWECIWRAKVPKQVSFFLWIVARGGILTIDNLVKRGQYLVNRCCLCFCDEETVDHLLLYCKFSHALWSAIFEIFGIHWVMPKTISSLLFAWRNWFGKHLSTIWNMVPACLMWLVWMERNTRIFEDKERTLDLLKAPLQYFVSMGVCLGFYELYFYF